MKVVSYVPTYRVVLTRRCAYACGYCDFTNRPSPTPPSLKTLRAQLGLAQKLGVRQVTLTAGEGIAELPEIVSVCRYYGYASWADYLKAVLHTILNHPNGRPVIPVLEVGSLPFVELQQMRQYLPAVRFLLHAADDALQYRVAHMHAPHKALAPRLEMLEKLGKLNIPTITGLTIGIGESRESWARAAAVVNAHHERYHHILQFVLIPFHPARRSRMENFPPVADETFLDACREVRRVLAPSIHLSAEIEHRLPLVADLVREGITDLGEIRFGETDSIHVDLPATLETLRAELRPAGIRLRERSTLSNGILRKGILPRPVADAVERQRNYRPPVISQGHESSAIS
jgi:7,8-didemethyl-8-hydroxy-5-deazariboflavin synthase CofG subunit